MMVARPRQVEHATFSALARHLSPGDLVVVNVSATLPAAVDAWRNGRPVVIHFSTPLDDGSWAIEMRAPDGSGPVLDGASGEMATLDGGGVLRILSPYAGIEGHTRLMRAQIEGAHPVELYLARHGRPITYEHASRRRPLEDYQTVFARVPGSAEMPSAGRPFTDRLVTQLVTAGVVLAPITLHAGVSSLDAGEAPLPERFDVPAPTAALVNHTRRNGGRVVAVGTTVTRALESAADRDGEVGAAAGWTDLVLGPHRPAHVVDALVTGWHPPEASHQLLLEAVAGRDLVELAYSAALDGGYLWHEFGDVCLFLP
jgi:S-adenosylmethionine:tRNA ribosyltransferase-isomerase